MTYSILYCTLEVLCPLISIAMSIIRLLNDINSNRFKTFDTTEEISKIIVVPLAKIVKDN